MTDQEKRIAVAEACGWKETIGWWCPCCRKIVNGAEVTYDEIHDPDSGGCGYKVQDSPPMPDYLNDLNAMHEAEKILTPAQCNIYEHRLGCFELANDPVEKRYFHRNAHQRCEAFLRTLGKWKGDEYNND